MSYLQHNNSPLTKKIYLFGIRIVKMVKFIKDTDYLQEKEFESMNTDCQEILALLISSIKTTKHNNETKWTQKAEANYSLFTIHYYLKLW